MHQAAISESGLDLDKYTTGPLLPGMAAECVRVAVVVTQLGFGGAEGQTVKLLERLKGSPWAPVVVICLSEDVKPHGSRVLDLGYPLEIASRQGSFDIDRVMVLRKLLRAYNVTLVHAVHLLAAAYSWIASRAGRDARVLPTFRSSNLDHGATRRFVYRRMLASCPLTLVNSHRGAEVLIRGLKARPERLKVVPNGLNFADLRNSASTPCLRAELGICADESIVGFVGRDRHVKNVPRFLKLAERLLDMSPRLHVVLVGVGLDESARGRLASALPESRTHFLGPRTDTPALLSDMDVLVITSESEGCPNVVLEALGLGVPVVSADVGDVPRMIRAAGHGAVVRSNDLESYVEQVLRHVSSRSKRSRAPLIDLSGLEHEYDVDRMVLQTVELWKNLMRNPCAS
jgi:glycosyltransferase involved in cell wall biosynthesis